MCVSLLGGPDPWGTGMAVPSPALVTGAGRRASRYLRGMLQPLPLRVPQGGWSPRNPELPRRVASPESGPWVVRVVGQGPPEGDRHPSSSGDKEVGAL